MYIYEKIGLEIGEGEILSIIGGGGKTTTLFLLGEELKRLNKRILITTTTAIYNPGKIYDYYFLGRLENFSPMRGSITIFGEKVERGKLKGISLQKLENIIHRDLFDFIIIEADGAKKRPIKAPAKYEPVVSEYTTKTIGIIGLDCLNKKIKDVAHRPEIFTKITKSNYIDKIDEDTIVQLILDEKGLFKGAYGECILLLNKACTDVDILKGRNIRDILMREGFRNKVIVADIKKKKFY